MPDGNVLDYLNTEFVFADAQLVQSSVDKPKKIIPVAIVGTQLSDTRISELEEKRENYDLSGYTLRVMQNKTIGAAYCR